MAKLKKHVANIYQDDGSGYIAPSVHPENIQTYEHPKERQSPEKKFIDNSNPNIISKEEKPKPQTETVISPATKKPQSQKQSPYLEKQQLTSQTISSPSKPAGTQALKDEIKILKTNNITSTSLTSISPQSTKPGNFTLIISEKPQAAMKIAFALSETTAQKKNFYGVPYWEIENAGKKYIIVSAVGHLYGLKQKPGNSQWPNFELEWQEKEGFSRKYVSAMKTISKDASDYILAGDYDIEGEVIGFNALRFICHSEKAKRMKFSALTKYDLLNSFKEIEPTVNYGHFYAGETRHYLDWFYGVNLSRALIEAVKSQGTFKILSIGRVQGPALALIVKKELEISSFISTPYWQVFLIIDDSKGNQIEVKFPENITSAEEAEKFLKLKRKKGTAKTDIRTDELKPFPPFDLTSLQIESYKFFHFSPAQTLAIAQKLYLAGLISYPRTSSQKLPPSIGYKRILDRLKQLFPKLNLNLNRDYPVQGGKTDPAHPAIYPTGEFSQKLSQEERKIYELIVKRFLACFAEDALIENRKITVNVLEKEFFIDGKRIIKQGWLQIYPYNVQENEIPIINGEIIVKEARTEQKMTQPPRRYSPASIILELEKRKLGTKTTRSMIIDTLYKRGYVFGSQIRASELGLATVKTLEKNSPSILDEQLTRKFEEEMEKIQEEKSPEKMKQEEQDILKEAKQIIIKISQDFKKNEQEIGKSLILANKEQEIKKQESSKLFSCSECKKGDLIMKRSFRGKRYVQCNNPDCEKTFPLPQFGMVKASDRKCEKCGRQMPVLIKKSRPPWYFCMNPGCWQQDAKEKAEKKEAKFKEKEEKALLKKKEQKEKAKAKRAKIRKKVKEKAKVKARKEKLIKKGTEKKHLI